jgi:hypothetical protein
MQKNPGMSISKYQVAALTYKPYIKAMSPENLILSFRKTGIFPYLRSCFFTTDVIVLVSKKLISPDCCSLSWLFSTSSVCETQQTVIKKATNKYKGKEIEEKMQEPQPNTSGLNNKGGPIELSSEDSQLFSDVELTDDEDV